MTHTRIHCGARLAFLLLFTFALCLISSGCDEDKSETTGGEVAAGEMAAGETTAGEMAAGETTAGEMAAGETTAGEIAAGETTAGEAIAGETAAGEMTAGETSVDELEELTQRAFEWLSGRFDSEDQSRAQPDFFAIQLLGCAVDAPNIGARALYIEQAVLDNPSAPYRQRLYVVESMSGSEGSPVITSTVFELINEDELIGLCDLPREERPTFGNADVSLRSGCEVYLAWRDDHFEGGTRGEECRSTLSGASYATSEVFIGPEEIRSWDRGFDASGEQVWGAVSGAYEFIRRE